MDRLAGSEAATRLLPGQSGKGDRVNALRRVMVVGGVSDTETVLRAVLEPRGTSVERSRNRRIEPQAPQSSPEVVVIDLDVEQSGSQTGRWQHASRVLIGSKIPQAINADDRFLEKPFQYPELVRMIEELLNTRPAA